MHIYQLQRAFLAILNECEKKNAHTYTCEVTHASRVYDCPYGYGLLSHVYTNPYTNPEHSEGGWKHEWNMHAPPLQDFVLAVWLYFTLCVALLRSPEKGIHDMGPFLRHDSRSEYAGSASHGRWCESYDAVECRCEFFCVGTKNGHDGLTKKWIHGPQERFSGNSWKCCRDTWTRAMNHSKIICTWLTRCIHAALLPLHFGGFISPTPPTAPAQSPHKPSYRCFCLKRPYKPPTAILGIQEKS